MNAEFQWWLLILGIVIGGALVYLVMADLRTDEGDPSPSDRSASDDDAADPGATPDRSGPPARSAGTDHPDVEGDGAEGETTVADVP